MMKDERATFKLKKSTSNAFQILSPDGVVVAE